MVDYVLVVSIETPAEYKTDMDLTAAPEKNIEKKTLRRGSGIRIMRSCGSVLSQRVLKG
jgi:hypothetical protein